MRHLVVGAGASVAEGLAFGKSIDECLPVMRNFARKCWARFNPHPFLDRFLEHLGYKVECNDARPLFYELEAEGETNVEEFFEFAWRNRHRSWDLSDSPIVRGEREFRKGDDVIPDLIQGLRARTPGGGTRLFGDEVPNWWLNMLHHGLGRPITDLMISCFFKNGVGWLPLRVSQSVVSTLTPADLVVNLNYDTVFELAVQQSGRDIAYAPADPKAGEITVAKPHGSLNLAVREDDSRFAFGTPDSISVPEPQGFLLNAGYVPPRQRKDYRQHPIARTIINSLRDRRPEYLTFWGVGFTESDADLTHLFRAWTEGAVRVEVINPSRRAARRIGELLNTDVEYYEDVNPWLSDVPTSA